MKSTRDLTAEILSLRKENKELKVTNSQLAQSIKALSGEIDWLRDKLCKKTDAHDKDGKALILARQELEIWKSATKDWQQTAERYKAKLKND